MEPVIKIENLGKKYILRHEQQEKYSTLRDTVVKSARSLVKKEKLPALEEFWALQDVSFDVMPGDRIGIIGRNGAGKSTLLKILSRITEPTNGRITIEGRIASLLEVGTGFHPELTGRENIFLNGSILGMGKSEIKRKFDEIVAFAEVEKFLDTPVKRYSSGMYVRLAFAVAAHLEPEILVVDEVLAVGDAEFQKKCLGKMRDVSGQGRTVLFVSHNMAAIQHLCDRCVYLKGGKLESAGSTSEVVARYLRAGATAGNNDLRERKDREGNGMIRFTAVKILDSAGQEVNSMMCGSGAVFEIGFDSTEKLKNFQVAVGIDDEYGQRITHFSNEVTNELLEPVGPGTVLIQIPKVPFKNGHYTFTLFSSVNGEIADWIKDAGSFYVESGDFYKTGKLPPRGQGQFFVEHNFRLK